MPTEPDEKATYRDLVEALGEEAEAARGEHPDLDRLVDLRAGALEPEAEERVRDHLAACRRCTELYLDLEPLAEPEAPAGERVADLELAGAWRRLQEELGAPSQVEREPARGRGAAGPWLRTAAAALAAVAVGLGAWSAYLLSKVERLEEPQVNSPVLYLDEPERAGGIEVPEVSFAPGHVRATVFLTPPGFEGATEAGAEYQVELATAGGRTVRTYRGLRRSDVGTLRFDLPRLEPGTYRARLAARTGAGAEPLAEYPFTVRWEDASQEP